MFERAQKVMPDKDCREPWFISVSHSDEDGELVLNAFEEALREVVG
jgi:hypothetical protein